MINSNIQLSIKHSPIAKPRENKGSVFTFNWQAVSLSPAQIVKHITSGKPIAVGQFEEGHRNKKHFIQSSLIALDYDGNYSDQDYQVLISNEFFRRYAFAIIQTASSKENSRRCRVLFQLDQVITNVNDYNDLVLFLMALAPDGADHGARDSSRAFYGSQPGTIPDFYNPLNWVYAAPFLVEIKQQRERQHQERATRYDTEFSGDFLKDIEKSLGVTEYNAEHWSNAVACIIAHEHDDTRPAAFWNEESHILHCFKCGKDYLAKDVANHFGIAYAISGKTDHKGDLSAAPHEEKRRTKYALCALPGELRKPMIKDGLTNFCLILDALLWSEAEIDQTLTMVDIAKLMVDHGMSQAAAYRAVSFFSHFLHGVFSSQKVATKNENNSRGRKSEAYTIADFLAALETHYSYTISGAGDYLYNHLEALSSARDYRMYALLGDIPEVEQTLSLETIGKEWGLSASTIGSYTRMLRDKELIEINRHTKRREITADMIPNLSAVLEEWKINFSNSYLEMYLVQDGIRVPYLHKGGKRGIPNNRIPPLYSVVMYFFHKTLKKNIIKSVNTAHSNLCLVLVSKLCNSYRRLPARILNEPMLEQLRQGRIAA